MAGDVAQDAAIARALEEPVGARIVVEGMGAQPHRVDHLADGALGDQIAGLDGGAHLEMLGIEHAIDAPGLALHPPDLVELGKAGHARLVGEHILAVAHGGD